MTKLRMICGTCGSEDVVKDAWAEWDEEAQQWVLRETFDAAYCHDCDASTEVECEEAET